MCSLATSTGRIGQISCGAPISLLPGNCKDLGCQSRVSDVWMFGDCQRVAFSDLGLRIHHALHHCPPSTAAQSVLVAAAQYRVNALPNAAWKVCTCLNVSNRKPCVDIIICHN